MAIFSFTQIEQNSETIQNELVPTGTYIGTIVEATTVVSKMGEPDDFKITWKTEKGKIGKRFAIWSHEEKKRIKALKDFNQLAAFHGVRLFDTNETDENGQPKKEFESDAFIGKENRLAVKHFVDFKNKTIAYVDNFDAPAVGEKDNLSKLIDDAITF